jgi:hypothetical protein
LNGYLGGIRDARMGVTISTRGRAQICVGWLGPNQPTRGTHVCPVRGTFKIQNILRVPTARQFDQGKHPEVCPFTDNRQDTNLLLGFGCGGTWPEYLASGSDKIRKRVSRCDMIVTRLPPRGDSVPESLKYPKCVRNLVLG